MEIYIKITDDDGENAWWTFDSDPMGTGEAYLCDGDDLWGEDEYGYEYCRGTPCKNVNQLKRETKEALSIARWDGMNNPKATFWTWSGNKLHRVKLTRDNKIVKI